MYGNTHNLKSLHLQASDGEMCLDDYLLSGLQKLESLTLQTCFQSFSKDLSKVTFKLKTLIVEHSHIINEDKFFDFIKSQTQLENVQFEINVGFCQMKYQ